MQTFESPILPQHESVEREKSKELSPSEQELIRDIMNSEKGRAMALPDGSGVLFAVPGPHGKQLEWIGSQDGVPRGSFTIRNQFDKRIVYTSSDGVHWENTEGQTWDMGGSGIPLAQFEEIRPFFSFRDE